MSYELKYEPLKEDKRETIKRVVSLLMKSLVKKRKLR